MELPPGTRQILRLKPKCGAGFIKLAIEQQAHLVPILVMGEICSLRNFIDIPALQQWTYKKIGFPVPYLVVGWGGCTPLPIAGKGLRFIIGDPIRPPLLELGQQVRRLADMSSRNLSALNKLISEPTCAAAAVIPEHTWVGILMNSALQSSAIGLHRNTCMCGMCYCNPSAQVMLERSVDLLMHSLTLTLLC